jgi:predicted metal-binding membrane protein
MPNMSAPHFGWLLVVAMWWVMMVAMMMPSAAPLVLLYAPACAIAGAPSGS